MKDKVAGLKSKFLFITFTLSLLALPTFAFAELTQSSNVDPVLGNPMLLDTSTGREWLSVTNTIGWSINQFMSSEYVNDHGFELASVDDVQNLWTLALHKYGAEFSGGPGSADAAAFIMSILGTSEPTRGDDAILGSIVIDSILGYTSTLGVYEGYKLVFLTHYYNMPEGSQPSGKIWHVGNFLPPEMNLHRGAAWAYRVDADADGDGIPDGQDQCAGNDNSGDTDSDGICDNVDSCDFDSDNDIDTDEVCGDVDNCPSVANSNQQDIDKDGLGDECDDDKDGDKVLNDYDNCPLVANLSQYDFDEDGIGDECDADVDGDAVSDDIDKCLQTPVGQAVNIEGCSIQELCPCDNDWKNHGAFMRCTAKTSEEFVEKSLITYIEKDIIVSEGAVTSCGQKK